MKAPDDPENRDSLRIPIVHENRSGMLRHRHVMAFAPSPVGAAAGSLSLRAG
ncbi:hypothetical protein [Komagataeibacter sp. FXV3]|uniref:hypothetical protein n=1 Tax=Komagataeibacter sp. FXV3 TaxID=2608998 RepID=UPI00187BA05C|nr:hypothetical protein [Komagataeibacter sp. FXV3]